MIASYDPLHWESPDDLVVWGLTIAMLWAGAVYFQGSTRRQSDGLKGEAYFTALAYTLLVANGAIAGLYWVGLVFLAILHVKTALWSFYELFYLLSIRMVFHVFPVLTLIAWGWSMIGWRCLHYAPRVVLLAVLLTLALALSAGSYFAMELGFRNG